MALSPLGKDVQPARERMTVSFAEDVAIEATSPEPFAQAAPDTAPELGEPAPEPVPMVAPPEPAARAVASPLPRPAAPVAKPSARPSPKPTVKAKAPAPADRRRADAPAGASRVGSDFLKGIPGGEARGAAQNPPAARAGPQVAASLAQAISRELKPRWNAPQGAEADQLVTVLSFDLNPDGSLAGKPRVVSQSGVTDANRAQQARHAEQAIRAVQLAAPFDLPEQHYSLWKRVASFRFDRRLSQ
ncbi:MAG: hypothetical protein Q8R44_06865 [Novosphingobium sp.]|nr:hypothetical protein [Novosphingobium sp.]